MIVGIFYFSVSGHSKYVAQRLRAKLAAETHGSKDYSITLYNLAEENQKFRENMHYYTFPSCDFYIVGTPTQNMRPNQFLFEYFESFPQELIARKPVACYTCHAGNPGFTLYYLSAVFTSRGAYLLATLDLKFVSNDMTKRAYAVRLGSNYVGQQDIDGRCRDEHNLVMPVHAFEIYRFDDWADTLLAKAREAQMVQRSLVPVPRRRLGNLVARAQLNSTRPERNRAYYFGREATIRISEVKCVDCMECVKACPTSCIGVFTMPDGTDKVLVQSVANCDACFACIQSCAYEAIDGSNFLYSAKPKYRFRPAFVALECKYTIKSILNESFEMRGRKLPKLTYKAYLAYGLAATMRMGFLAFGLLVVGLLLGIKIGSMY